jgi:2-dehydropantoate 2-reductase
VDERSREDHGQDERSREDHVQDERSREDHTPATSIALVGPGAIGATLAAYLHRSGHPVLLCGHTARDRLEVRPDPGVLSGEPIIVPGPVHTDPAEVSGPVDVVLLAIKVTQLDAAAGWLARLCDQHTVVCALQNGVEQVELVGPYCPGSLVVPGIVWFGAEPQPGGWVRLRGRPAITLPPANGGVAELLTAAGCEITVAADFTTAAWRKLLTNALAGLMVLTGRRSGMFRRDDVAELSRRYLAECLAVARAEGANLGDGVITEIIDMFVATPTDMTTSMLTDREAHRPLEWQIRNGVVLRRARQHGLPAPISEVLVPLLAAASDGPG